MKDWKQNVVVIPAAAALTWDSQPAPDAVANYRVYFREPDARAAYPYEQGIVVEEWKDGRFYFLEFNEEFIVATLAEAEALVEEFAKREGYLNSEQEINE